MTYAKKMVLLSCGLAALYLVSMLLGEIKTIAALTGDASVWHEAIGILILIGMGVHMFCYWRQIKLAVVHFFHHALKHKLFMILNVLTLGMVCLTVISGVIISPQLGFGEMGSAWRHLHHVVPKLTLLLVLIHVLWRLPKIIACFKK